MGIGAVINRPYLAIERKFRVSPWILVEGRSKSIKESWRAALNPKP